MKNSKITDNPSYITSINDLFRNAAPYAIYKWVESEKKSLDHVKYQIDENSLSRWINQWNLHWANPKSTRKELMKCLMEIKPRIMEAKKEDLPEIVDDGVKKLADTTGTSQTSLISKFAFSLRPNIGAPYDRYALAGLRTIYECSIDDHNYTIYFKKFNRFAAECGKTLDEMGQTEALNPLWQPFMNKLLFKRRTADKSLMFLGNFIPPGKLDFWCKFQANYHRCS